MRVFLKGQEVNVKLWNECEAPLELPRKQVVIKKVKTCQRLSSSHPWKQSRNSAAFEREVKAKIREEMRLVI